MLLGLEGVAAGLLYLNAAAIECKRQPVPPVRIIPSKSAIQYDNTKGQDELDRMEIDTVNPYGKNKDTHVGGLMSGEIRIEHQIGFVQERYEQLGQACLHYDSVTVNIIINPTIYIARENRPGTCRYHAIMEHEKKHVEADRIVVNKYAKRIGDSLAFALNKYGVTFGPFGVDRIAPVQSKLQTYIDGIVKTEVDAMNTERMRLQQSIDSLEEYERVRKLCR